MDNWKGLANKTTLTYVKNNSSVTVPISIAGERVFLDGKALYYVDAQAVKPVDLVAKAANYGLTTTATYSFTHYFDSGLQGEDDVKFRKYSPTIELAAGMYHWSEDDPTAGEVTVSANIEFESKNTSFTTITVGPSIIKYGDTTVCQNGTWVDDAYRNLQITSGKIEQPFFNEVKDYLYYEVPQKTYLLSETPKLMDYDFSIFAANNSFQSVTNGVIEMQVLSANEKYSPFYPRVNSIEFFTPNSDGNYILEIASGMYANVFDGTWKSILDDTYYTVTDTTKLRTLTVTGICCISLIGYYYLFTLGNWSEKVGAEVSITYQTSSAAPVRIYDGVDDTGIQIDELSYPYNITKTYNVSSGHLFAKWVNAEEGRGVAFSDSTGAVIANGPLATVNGNGTVTLYEYLCLTGDTLITLADGSEKRIDSLRMDDKVLSYNEQGELVASSLYYTDSDENKSYVEYDVWTFDDGTIVKTVHRHRFYNVEHKAMMYMDEWKIGEHARTLSGNNVALVAHENVKEEVKHYTLFTEHQNYFANGLLSGNRWTKTLNI